VRAEVGVRVAGGHARHAGPDGARAGDDHGEADRRQADRDVGPADRLVEDGGGDLDRRRVRAATSVGRTVN
jgi:hypothetical protein